MSNISGIIVARDRPKHLFETVASVEPLVDELIIADIGLTQETVTILKKNKKITVIPVRESIPYVELIREKLKDFAHGEYILVLDPDEVISRELANQLRNTYERYDFIRIPRKNIIFGKWIQHARWWPDYQIRLFKKDKVTWPIKLHCQPETTGSGYTIEPQEQYTLIHYNYDTIDEFFAKAVRYAKSEATELAKQQNKFTLRHALKTALSEFISRYFADEGYKDGMHGFILSFFQMLYCFMVYSYYWEMKHYPNADTNDVQQAIDDFFREGLFSVRHWQSQNNLKRDSFGIALKKKIVNRLLQ